MFLKRIFLTAGLLIGMTGLALFVFEAWPRSNAGDSPEPAVTAAHKQPPTPIPATATPQDYLDLPSLGPAPEIDGVTHWVNSSPLTLKELRGQVVLIDFWTFGCINCVRTLPYVSEWHQKYADEGLVIIGIHRPEFTYEHSTANVEDALDRFEIGYPVAQDNDFTTWRAYKNRYWPAFYFVDKQGEIRYIHIGEGSYEKSERIIQQLLAETSAVRQ